MKRFTFACATAVALIALLAAQRPPNASIQGIITDPDGTKLPGALIKVESEGEGRTRQAYSNVEGAYAIYGLLPGDYTIVAHLDGFCGQRRTAVHVRSRTATYVDFSMDLAPIDYPGLRVVLSPTDAVRYADAVVHLRISKSYELLPWRGGDYCGVAGVEHEAFVLRDTKRHPLHGPTAARVRFLQSPVGRWVDGVFEAFPVDLYQYDDEFVALLMWNEDVQRFQPLGDRYMIPVHDGIVSWEYERADGLRDGMPVEEFIAALRLLMQPAG